MQKAYAEVNISDIISQVDETKINLRGKMKTRLTAIVITITLLFASSTSFAAIQLSGSKAGLKAGTSLKIHYIDVGQGDSILVQYPNGANMLIDAGPGSAKADLVAYLKAQNITKLDAVVVTHPHEDHIGGMTEVINNFTIGSFYMPNNTQATNVYKSMAQALKNKGLKAKVAKAGVTIDLDSNVSTDMVAPVSDKYSNVNNYSTVIKVAYKQQAFLFTGDAEELAEEEILNSGADIKSGTLKVGHHGSRTATSDAFLNSVAPKYAVISCGVNNKYDHPHQETLDKLDAKSVTIYRTDLQGSIVLTCNGTTVTFTTEKKATKTRLLKGAA